MGSTNEIGGWLLGWYLDEIVVFLLRTLFRLIRDRSTRKWPTVEGEIHTSGRSSSFYPTAEITYMYRVNEERHANIHERAFFFRNSAEEYSKRFIPKCKVTIRYNADDPDKSFVSAHDQVAPTVWATRNRDLDVENEF
ncbi:MAG TPA: DUF3592 domain-containing protein [Bryobacteraceae bacterium]